MIRFASLLRFYVLRQAVSSRLSFRVDTAQGREREALQPQETDPADWLMWAYTPDYLTPTLVKAQKKIFNIPQDAIDMLSVNRMTIDKITSESILDFSTQTSNSFGIEGSYNGFTAAAQQATEQSVSWGYNTMRVDKRVEMHKYRLAARAFNLAKYLTPEAQEFLHTAPPERIVRDLGEYYPSSMVLGGMLQLTHLQEKTWKDDKHSVEEGFDAKYGGELAQAIKGSSQNTFKESTKEGNVKVRTSWVCLGGNSNIWFSLSDDSANLNDIKQRWGQSVSDDNLYPVDLTLSPIWRLLNGVDEAKRQALKDYLTNKWEQDKLAVPAKYDAPVHHVCRHEYNTACAGLIGALLPCGNDYVRVGTSACVYFLGAGASAKCRKTYPCALQHDQETCCGDADSEWWQWGQVHSRMATNSSM